MRNYFPGDTALFNSIDKFFHAFARNIQQITTDGDENPLKLYLKYREKTIIKTGDSPDPRYLEEAETGMAGKNTYKFEFVQEKNKPFMNIWLLPKPVSFQILDLGF